MPSPLAVVDASLVIKAILPNPEITQCQAILDRLQGHELVAPALWVYEVTSTLTKAVHFGQITAEEGGDALEQALRLGVHLILLDPIEVGTAYAQTLALQRSTAYDSFYLVLAKTLEADFWTADKRLIRSMGDQKPAWLRGIGDLTGD